MYDKLFMRQWQGASKTGTWCLEFNHLSPSTENKQKTFSSLSVIMRFYLLYLIMRFALLYRVIFATFFLKHHNAVLFKRLFSFVFQQKSIWSSDVFVPEVLPVVENKSK